MNNTFLSPNRLYKDRLFKMIFTVPEGRPSAKDLISILDEIKRKEM